MNETEIDLHGQVLAHRLILEAVLAAANLDLATLSEQITGSLQRNVQTGASREEQAAGRYIAAACTETDLIFSGATQRRRQSPTG